jgi:hypothetical protein
MEEQEDFDNLYSSKLPNFASNDWRALEGQLERHDLKRQLTRLMWALPAVGGIMLAVSSVLYYQLNKTREQVRTLETKLVDVHRQQRNNYLQDISPQKIIMYDTIYRQVVIKQIVQQVPSSDFKLTNNQNDTYYNKQYEENFTDNQLITEREKYVGIHKILSKNPTLSNSEIKITNDFANYKGEVFPEDSTVTESRFSLIPKSVSVGVLGGLYTPMNKDFENGGGKDIGVRTVLGYHNSKGQERWGIVLDFQQSSLSFDNRPYDSNKRRMYERLAQGPSPRPDGTIPPLDKVEIAKSMYNIGVGLRYNLLFSEKIRPYFGVNWTLQIPKNGDINYFYEDKSKPIKPNQPEVANMNFWGINAGTSIFLNKRFAVNTEAYLQAHLRDADLFETPLILGGRVGVSYRLGN